MKQITIVLMLLFSLSIFQSCEKDDPKEPEQPKTELIVGTWKFSSSKLDVVSIKPAMYRPMIELFIQTMDVSGKIVEAMKITPDSNIEFKSDNTCSIKNADATIEGNYTIEGKILTLNLENQKPIVFDFEIEIESDNAILDVEYTVPDEYIDELLTSGQSSPITELKMSIDIKFNRVMK